VVIGNGAATLGEDGWWRLARTAPLATYFVTVCAGPYLTRSQSHDGIPLFLHARQSLSRPLDCAAEELFEVTRSCFDAFHDLFGIRYPFGEYHQVFVPEFNAGAMENPGCVTLRDQMLHRGAVTPEERMQRAVTVAHEMAHMWFGDLVTMRWWDDLWLNESFAEYLGHRVCVAATEFTDAWTDFSISRKAWGYAAERMPSTHPVAGGSAPDAAGALLDFDGISYAKGAAALRQLIAYLGDDAFVRGVRAYVRGARFGNATLADFLAAIEQAGGVDLGPWAQAWLATAGVDTLSVEVGAESGRVGRAVLRREPPAGGPAWRPHALDVAGYSGGRRLWQVDARVEGLSAPLSQLVGAPAATVVVPNAGDLTWARVRLSPETVAALPAELPLIADDGVRAVLWLALIDGMAHAEVDPRDVLRVFGAAWPREHNASLVGRVAAMTLGRLVPAYLLPAEQEAAVEVVARAAGQLAEAAEPGSWQHLAGLRRLAETTRDQELLRRWAAGQDLPATLTDDDDFRWVCVRALARRGWADEALIASTLAADGTLTGHWNALAAQASRPDPEAKARAWARLVSPDGVSNYERNHLAAGFWKADDLELVRPYARRYVLDVPALAGLVGEDALQRVAANAFPAALVEEPTAALVREALNRTDLSAAVRRAMVDGLAELEQALASQRRFGPR
jgi:aminopeptidase N